MTFEIISEVFDVETIAVGRRIREFPRVQHAHGRGRWRKLKGIARVRFADGTTILAEVHWYEAHGIGRREIKLKRFLPQ